MLNKIALSLIGSCIVLSASGISQTVDKINKTNTELEQALNSNAYSILNKYADREEARLIKYWLMLSRQQNNNKNLNYFIHATKGRMKYALGSLNMYITDHESSVIEKKINDTKKIDTNVSLDIPNFYTHKVKEDVNIRFLPIPIPYTLIKSLKRGKKLKLLYEIQFTLSEKTHYWSYVIYDDENNKGWINSFYIEPSK